MTEWTASAEHLHAVQGWKPSKCVHVHVWCNFLRTAMVRCLVP